MREAENTLSIRQYLLGRLESTKQEELEQRLLTDDAFLEEVLIAEDDLIDDFLNNNLPPDEQESFRGFFLSTPDRREKLRFGKTFKGYINSTPLSLSKKGEAARGPSWIQSFVLYLRSGNMATAFSLAAAILFAVLAGWLFVRERNLQAQLENLRAEKAQSAKPSDSTQEDETRRKISAAELAQIDAEIKQAQQRREELERYITRLETEKRGAAPDKTTSLTSFMTPVLAMGAVRSGEGGLQEIRVPAGTGVLNIPLSLPGADDGIYRATLTVDGKTLHTRGNLQPKEIGGEPVVILSVPAKVLKPGEYRIRLARTTGDRKHVGSYDFRIS